MTSHCRRNLENIKDLLLKIENQHYVKPIEMLSGATIGQHTRHILEFYLCLFDGLREQKINYENRKRNSELETNLHFASTSIEHILLKLPDLLQDAALICEKNFSSSENTCTAIPSSLYRELTFCLDHSIHHQALIKIGLRELGLKNLVTDQFGVDPATIRYKSKCAQ